MDVQTSAVQEEAANLQKASARLYMVNHKNPAKQRGIQRERHLHQFFRTYERPDA